MYFMSWYQEGHHIQIICNDGQSVFFVVDMLEKEKVQYKVTDMFHMITASHFGGCDDAYKFWINGK